MPKLNNRKTETQLIENFRNADPADQDFILITSYFHAQKSWTPTMIQHLEVLAALCFIEPTTN